MAKRDEPDRKHNQYKIDRDAKELLIRKVKSIEKLADEKQAIADDIKDIYLELKSMGFDTAAIREVVAERKKRRKASTKFEEREDWKDLYRVALGM